MIKNNIRIFDLTFDEQFRKKFSEGSKKILDEGFLANHSYVKKFEKEFSKKVGSKFAVAVNNGTSAIEVPLRALNLNGKDVLLGTNTFIATAIAIKNAGGNPIPIDIEDEYYSLCPKRLEASITNKTAAVILIQIM